MLLEIKNQKFGFKFVSVALVLLLSSCSNGSLGFMARTENVNIPKGPPIENIVTPFDDALSCLKGLVPAELAFSVGIINDNTGKEQYSDGGSGKIVTQGASDIVQSALFTAGVKVVNRRDASIAITETNWGIRNIKQQTPAAFFVTGSINSLDFIPGGGARFEIAGVGPRYRENRILVGLDLSLTDTATGEVVSNVPMQKQIFSREMGASSGRFVGDSLVNIDMGAMQREALNSTLRQMLNYATFQLLGQVVSEEGYKNCAVKVEVMDGTKDTSLESVSNRSALNRAVGRDIAPLPPVDPNAPQQVAAPAPPKPIPEAAMLKGQQTTSLAAKAIAKAEEVQTSTNLESASALQDQAVKLLTDAIAALRESASMGLSGAEGDGVALVVEQAILAVQKAEAYVQTLEKVSAGKASPINPAPIDGGGKSEAKPAVGPPSGTK